MGLFDLFGTKATTLTLDVATMERWPDRLIRRQGLDKALREHHERVLAAREKVEHAKEALSDPAHRTELPESIQPLYDTHLPTLRNAIEDLLLTTVLSNNLFNVEEEIASFQEALTTYQEVTSKSTHALKEYLGEPLHQLQKALQELEDAMVSILPQLEQKEYGAIKSLREKITEYKESREREAKLQKLKELLLKELDILEAKKRKEKERIKFFMERARNNKFKELIAEEEELLKEMDAIKVKGLPDEEKALAPIKERLAWLRKQMINDITAMNINEQRTFLEATKDEIRLRRRKLERIDELLTDLSFETYKEKFFALLEPFNVRIEDMKTVFDVEDEDVAPQ